MKKVILAALLLMSAGTANAGPIRWLKRQASEHPVRTKLVVAGLAAGVYAEGLHQCRLGGVENCQEHYGAAWAGYGTTVGADLVGVLVGEKIGGKVGNVISYGSSVTMLGWGVYQWNGGLNKPKDEVSKPDLGSIVVIRRD